MDASEIYSKRLDAKEVIFPREKGEFIFPISDGRIKPLERDQDLRTSTLVRHRPLRGQSHIDFLGESEGSLPPLHDSFPDAGERTNDFWSMSIASVQKQNLSGYRRIYKNFLSRKSLMLTFLRSSAKLVKSFPADWGRRFGEPLIGSMILSGR